MTNKEIIEKILKKSFIDVTSSRGNTEAIDVTLDLLASFGYNVIYQKNHFNTQTRATGYYSDNCTLYLIDTEENDDKNIYTTSISLRGKIKDYKFKKYSLTLNDLVYFRKFLNEDITDMNELIEILEGSVIHINQ